MWRRLVWTLVALTAAYILTLMLTTPTPKATSPGGESGILSRFLPNFSEK